MSLAPSVRLNGYKQQQESLGRKFIDFTPAQRRRHKHKINSALRQQIADGQITVT